MKRNLNVILRLTFPWALAVAGQSTSDESFIGWWIQPDNTRNYFAGAGWSTSGTVAGDCPTGVPLSSCVFTTGCTSNTELMDNGDVQTCNSTQTCVAATIFETVPFGAPSATNWRCREKGFAASILYRNLPTSVTWETTIYATVTPTITTPPPDAPSRTSSPSASSQPTSLSPSPNDGENKAWIAGAVLGPIAFLALGAATYWSWMRRREQHKRKPKIAAKQEARFQDDDTQQAGPQYGPQYGPQSGPQPELSDAAAVFMLPASPVQRTPELPGY